MNLKQNKLLDFLLPIFLLFLNSCTFKHVSYPKAYQVNIIESLNTIIPLIFQEYKKDSFFYVKNVQNLSLQKHLSDLNINSVKISYKVDTTNKLITELQIPNDIFNSIMFLDSCIDFHRNNNVLLFDKSDTNYGVSYLFGSRKPKISKKKDEFHNLIKPINDSIFIFRQNLPKTR